MVCETFQDSDVSAEVGNVQDTGGMDIASHFIQQKSLLTAL